MKRTVQFISIIFAFSILFINGCYTQIKVINQTTKSPSSIWYEQNDYYYMHHNPCRWCRDWHYYYYYPWWLDQNWWWDEYYYDSDEIDYHRDRIQRRRGLGDQIDSIIRAFEDSDDDQDDDRGRIRDSYEDEDQDDNQDDQDNPEDNENENTRPSRRRGM